MTLGFIMYFYYGITHSSMEQTSDELELHVDKDYSKNVDDKAVWDQQSYNQTHEPVWASKEVKQSTNKRYSYGKSATSGGQTGGRNTSGASKSGGDSAATSAKDARAAPAPPSSSARSAEGRSRPLEHQYTGQFSMFVDEGQFPTWDD
ncbi:hypothetical protein AWZ03_013982 [Drosophila navojoa]|uniref:Uncharacterized protein n=2 Tax=Drosophila navojoa TaxID=7232 RepID=A0A484AVK3_DRONA|nr:hypothetical protein AWZ03_013982 [Drosophila navojoa]